MAQVGPTETKLFLKPQEPPQTFHKSIKPFTIVANCLGLLPVYGITSNSVDDLNFRWISLKPAYNYFFLLQAFCGSVLHLISLFKNGISSSTLVGFSGYFEWFLLLATYIYLARRWPKLIKKWYAVDLSMQRVYDYPENLNARFKVIGAVAFVFAALYIVINFPIGNELVSNAFNVVSADIGTEYISQVLNGLVQMQFIIVVFSWTFNDMFIIIISTALALRFKQVTDRVVNYGRHMQSLEFWSEIRTDYIHLFELYQLINEYISFNITVSFVCNTWYLLLDLFLVIRYSNTQQSVKVAMSSASSIWCILSIFCTTFYTAWVNDESKRFADALNIVPSKNYNLAIELLMEQIPFNPVALSGNDIFRCTRGLILNIVGALITYELLLVQFSDAVIPR